MRVFSRTQIAVVGLAACLAAGPAALAQTPSPAVPTPATPGPNPGQSATDAVTSPAKPPAEFAPSTGTQAPASGAPAVSPNVPSPTVPAPGAIPPAGRVQYTPPPAGGTGDLREVVDLMRVAATSARESVDYQRVVPDILTQILAKLDKIEDKLDKVETAAKGGNRRR